jgi:hypothetical protein
MLLSVDPDPASDAIHIIEKLFPDLEHGEERFLR